jgi:hypothetical protein
MVPQNSDAACIQADNKFDGSEKVFGLSDMTDLVQKEYESLRRVLRRVTAGGNPKSFQTG